MDKSVMDQVRPRSEVSPRLSSPDIQPSMQSLVATLAEMEFAHEHACGQIRGSSLPVNQKIGALEKLKAQHRERKQPYLQQLAILEARIRALGQRG